MTELLSSQAVDFLSAVVLPALSILVALATLVFTLRWTGRTLTRSVTPQIECFLRVRESSQVFDLVIANFGLGTAYRVSFQLDVDEDDFDAHRVIMTQRAADIPFSVIEPGGQITNMFGVGPALLGTDPPLKPFTATVTYEWQPFWSRRRRVEQRQHDMDVRPFLGLVPEWKKDEVAAALKAELPKIAKAVGATQRPPVPADRKSSGLEFFRRIEGLMPELFAEMRADLKSFPMKREFIVMPKLAMYNAGQKQPLLYHYEDHEDLADKVGLLVNEGVVTDITYNNVDRYVMSETLVEYLAESAAEDPK
ncbi:MAG: hypothetical protein F4205_08400 [Gemmatimonadetes bacterium]|nr:hypothetical protein [Gemmatimonadota bacterium]MYG35501.1 hypothetical protein [Gemmatimonadota bacterium]